MTADGPWSVELTPKGSEWRRRNAVNEGVRRVTACGVPSHSVTDYFCKCDDIERKCDEIELTKLMNDAMQPVSQNRDH